MAITTIMGTVTHKTLPRHEATHRPSLVHVDAALTTLALEFIWAYHTDGIEAEEWSTEVAEALESDEIEGLDDRVHIRAIELLAQVTGHNGEEG